MTDAPAEKLLTVKQVAERFGVDERTVRRWADEKLLPCIRTLGARGDRRFKPADVEAALRRE